MLPYNIDKIKLKIIKLFLKWPKKYKQKPKQPKK